MVTVLLMTAHLAITVATPQGIVSDAVASASAAEADAIWHAAGVDIQWSIGDRPGWHPDEPMLWVLFADRCSGEGPGTLPLASVTFVDGRPEHRIIVCRTQVLALVMSAEPAFRELPQRRRDALVARVSGRAIAHEIGHYLLGPEHAHAGLMRARHSVTDFCGTDAAPFAPAMPSHVARSLPTR